ncbi:anaerobic C4-dicarboxylate transporter [Helicobacter sp. 16-1353]|uniref:anaerobic C4-dicarboxylate transporter n=1 Tax=Helicobacter sp. 16-1353 TaxID=2004996 RepID=UPI000DCF0755|nr:anaerobic C4-dicarboxylate transporter [Helicobacter sp. 16-1353]RAX51724.1 anaerobic C4-dicarboxylate transporter [Helicobacter sp. 16-1353]
MEFLTSLSEGKQFAIQIIIILICLFYGAKKGGIVLGLLGGVGLFVLTFFFGIKPGKPAIDVIFTILCVVVASATLLASGGLDVMLQIAERILRRNPKFLTILAPFVTCFLTILCGTGHVVYTMMPIIYDIAIKNNIRPERPMAAASVSSQMGIIASPVSVAVVSLTAMLLAPNVKHLQGFDGYVNLLMITIPATLVGVLVVGIYSWFRGKDLDKDMEFQEKLKDPEFKQYVYGDTKTLLGVKLPNLQWVSMFIFLGAIAVVALLGIFPSLRPHFDGKAMSMVSTIQMFMLIVGSLLVMFTNCKVADIGTNAIFRSGMIAIVAVFGISWMVDSMFAVHTPMLKESLGEVVKNHPWTYAIMLLLISKFVNSQAAALAAFVPIALAIGVEPGIIVAFAPACYGYYILPTYPSDLATIQFDRSGTTRIGKFVINHSFIIPGLLGVFVSCVVGYILASVAGYI